MKFFVKTCLLIWPTPLLDSAEPAYAPCSLTCTIMQALNFLGQTFLCCFVLLLEEKPFPCLRCKEVKPVLWRQSSILKVFVVVL